ncbi:Rid family detoxifying hydrolase [Chloroflexota bacterium]
MPGKRVIPKGSPPPLAPYSPGMQAGNTVYVSGALPLDSKGELIGKGDIKAQTEKVIQNIHDVLEAAGASLQDVVMNNVFLTDMKNYAAMNEVYGKYFGQNPPARYCVKCDLVKPDFLVEIATIAVISR